VQGTVERGGVHAFGREVQRRVASDTHPTPGLNDGLLALPSHTTLACEAPASIAAVTNLVLLPVWARADATPKADAGHLLVHIHCARPIASDPHPAPGLHDGLLAVPSRTTLAREAPTSIVVVTNLELLTIWTCA